MKLHLPKQLFTALLTAISMAVPAAVTLGSAAWGEGVGYASGVTYDLLESGDDWVKLSGQSSRFPVYNAATDDTPATITTTNWGQALAVYSTPSRYAYTVDSTGVLSFSLTLQTDAPGNSVAAISLTGVDETLVFGSPAYSSSNICYSVTSNTSADIYLYNTDSNWGSGEECYLAADEVKSIGTRTSNAYTLNGTVTLKDDGNYWMDLMLDGASVGQSVNLGTSFDISRITLQTDGGSHTLSNLTITGNLFSYRYDATVSGSLAANEVTWSRNGETYASSEISAMKDGSAILGLTGEGDNATISFDEGTDVAIIDILGGKVIFDGTVETSELTVADGASFGVAETGNLTLSSSSGIMNADYVLGATGTGTIHLQGDVNIGSDGGESDFAGTISVDSGTLYLGNVASSGGSEMEAIDFSDAKIALNGGSIRYFGGTSTIGTLDVKTDGTLLIHGTNKNANEQGILNLNTVNVASEKLLTVNAYWEYNLHIGALTGEGSLQLNNGSAGTGTITIDSIGAGFGNITNAGTLNLVGQLAGSSTISGGTINVADTASVSGNITFGSDIHIEDTIESTGAVALVGNVYVNNLDNLERGDFIYSSNEGKDGFITSALFYVVKGDGNATAKVNDGITSTLYEGSTSIGSISSSADGKSLVVNSFSDFYAGTWFVNTQDFTVDGTDANPAKDATRYVVAAGRTLTIDAGQSSTMTSSKILTETTGAGNITLSTDAMVGNNSATQATGTLTVNSGATLKVGDGTGHNSSIASFGAVNLNGGTLRMHNNGSTVNNLTVSKESTLRIQDANAATATTRLAGDTMLNAELNVTSGFKGTLTIDKLKGTGNLDIDADDNAYNDTLLVNINGLTDYSGVISYKASSGITGPKANNKINIKNLISGTSYGAVSMGGFTVESKDDDIATATIDIGSNASYGASSLGAVTLIGGSELTMFNRDGAGKVNMSSLTVTGAATIQTARNANCFHSEVNIGSLVNGNQNSAATLNLISGGKSSAVMAYNLNGGSGFTGTINLKSDADSGGDRRLALNINSADAAKGAIINFLDASTIDAANGTAPDAADINANKIALGLGTSVTIAGLGTEVVEGQETVLTTNAVEIRGHKIKTGVKDFTTRADDDTDTSARTLTIDTAAGKSYDVKANINDNINLVKTGSGTQSISGNVSAMNGFIRVEEGKLAFAGTGTTSASGIEVYKDATLQLGVNNAATNGSMLAAATGSGNVAITAATTLTAATQATGSLTVGNGGATQYQLSVGSAKDDATSKISSFSSVELDNGKLYFHSMPSTIQNLTVSGNGGNLTFEDTNNMSKAFNLSGTTTLNGDLTINSTWKYNVDIDLLIGTGDLKINGKSNTSYADGSIVNIDSLQGYTGAISFTRQASTGACTLTINTGGEVNLAGLTLDGKLDGTAYGVQASLTASGDSSLGAVSLTNGSSLSIAGEGSISMTSLNLSAGTTLTHAAGSIQAGDATLAGTINVTDVSMLATDGEVTYSQGSNGFKTATYYVISEGNLTYTDDFALQLNGAGVDVDKTVTDKLTISTTGDLYYVNTSETLAASTANRYFIAADATLTIDGAHVNVLDKDITGTGTLAVSIGKNTEGSHGNYVTAEDFNGVVQISRSQADADGNRYGNTNLVNYALGDEASFKLVSGNHWSQDGNTITRDIVLAGADAESFTFEHAGTLELSGKVTGTFLTAGKKYNDDIANNLTLSGEGSSIGAVTMKGGMLTVKADMEFGTLSANSVTVDPGVNLTLGTDETTTSTINQLSAAESTIVLKGKTTLNLEGGASAETPVIHSIGTINAGAGASINLAAAATLNRISTGSVVLEGYGTYDFGDYDIGGGNENTSATYNSAINVTYGAGWYGTVRFGSGSTFTFKNLDLEQFANGGNSTIELAGVTGYLQSSTSSEKTYSADFKFTGDGFTIGNGYGGSKYKFSGDFSGLGNLTLDKDLDGGLQFTFAGDMSEWTGELKHQKDSQNKYIYDAADDVLDTSIGNKLTAAGANMEVTVKTNRDVVMNGELRATAGSTLNVTKENGGNLSVKSVAVETTGVVKVAGLSISATDSQENATMTQKADTQGALTRLQEDASFTIEDMTLTNTTITAATAETRVNLNNVSGDATLAKGTFGLQMQAGTPNVGLGGASLGYGVAGTPSLTLGTTDAKLVITADPSADVSGIYRDYTLTFNLNVSLDSIPQSGDDWKALVGFDGWLGTMLENQNATYQVADGAAQVSEGASAPAVSYGYAAGGGGGNVGTLVITISGLNVPEPASATLGLAALMMLCARRRRKA